MNNAAKFVAYLQAYEAKDLDSIRAMLTAGVRLRDWKISVVGIEAVLAETMKNFAAARSIDIRVLTTCQGDDTVAGELKVTVDGSQELFVVDVLRFDEAGQIVAIHAYLGRPDEDAMILSSPAPLFG